MTNEGASIRYYRLTAAARLVGLPPSRVRRYLQLGLIWPATVERGRPLLSELELARLRKIRRLSTDLGLNAAGVEVAMRLLDEITALRAEMEQLRAGRGGAER